MKKLTRIGLTLRRTNAINLLQIFKSKTSPKPTTDYRESLVTNILSSLGFANRSIEVNELNLIPVRNLITPQNSHQTTK